ncbi:hypothetical protein RB195_013819 [Necator americanus]|uniref:Uncharacterized protein n=1 Tax=Necator americanus TaxID=51031 RepID=A0ABR1DXB9_NECAM
MNESNDQAQKNDDSPRVDVTQYRKVQDTDKLPEENATPNERTEIKDTPSARKKRSDKTKEQLKTGKGYSNSASHSSKKKKKYRADRMCEATQDETPKRVRSQRRVGKSCEKTAIITSENVIAKTYHDESEEKMKRGRLKVAEMRSRRSKRNPSPRKKKTQQRNKTVMHVLQSPAIATESDQMKSFVQQPVVLATTPPSNAATPPKDDDHLMKTSLPIKPIEPTPTIGSDQLKEEGHDSNKQISLGAKPSKTAPAGIYEPPKDEKRQASIRMKLSRSVSTVKHEPGKEERSVRQTSIRERLKRGLKSAFSAFSRASLEKSFQNAKAKLTAPKRTNSLYDYQDTYMGRAMEEEEEPDDTDIDQDFYKDTSHRHDLVLVDTNNTNNGQMFNEKGLPFWKDKKYLSEVPRPTRQPLSTLLLMLSEKKMSLKDSVATPACLDGLELGVEEMKCRDTKHFNDDLLLSNTIRSIISTLDDIDKYSQNKPVDIQKLTVLEPKTSKAYTRHCPKISQERA